MTGGSTYAAIKTIASAEATSVLKQLLYKIFTWTKTASGIRSDALPRVGNVWDGTKLSTR
jgi:hypothetical protein